VATRRANAFGLYDMSGNGWEWVQDYFHDSYRDAPVDGSAWMAGGDQQYRVLRGGSWGSDAWHVRASLRGNLAPGDRDDYVGFRLARTVNP
jgi:formylglycine-generating enzyme required for sulfatase activity